MPQDWREKAKCAGIEEEAEGLFFLGRGQSPRRARLFCGGCPVELECLNYAILYHERGIWGGMTEEERDTIEADVRPHLLEQALLVGLLEVRYDSSALLASSSGPILCPYCGVPQCDTCQSKEQHERGSLQTTYDILATCTGPDETDLDLPETG